ncbi:MAG TPA: ribosome small subunit-dependent GTPase A [Vicinamibacterales bacterium]|nr:ribosome small subunit-dependent GTPase A [Vicinamibacterales bacterium]
MTLDDLGWSPQFAAAFEEYRSKGWVPARVSLEHTHIYRVLMPDGEHLARVSGRLRHHASRRSDFPAVGDWVAVEQADDRDVRVHAVLPRKAKFSRRAAGDVTEEQIVAANVDVVLLVSGLDFDFNPRRIERYLLTAWDSGASPVVVLNKADLVDDVTPFVEEVAPLAAGVPVVPVSTRIPESIETLRSFLGRGRTGAMLGSSGVGKSSIVNALLGEDRLRTREVRQSDSRGRHTSTARELLLLPDHSGILIDTPGMRELQLWDSADSMGSAFTDIEALAAGCRFRDCRHSGEPGCAVGAAVETGRLSPIRLESFQKLQAEQAHQERQADQRAALEQKRRFKVLTKALNKKLKEDGP